MYILITYDVSTQTAEGKRRLRQVAKTCENIGQRVQNSVFECQIPADHWVRVKNALLKIVDLETDSLRFYHLGKNWKIHTEHHGSKPSYDISGPLII